MARSTNQNGIDLIKKYEGLRTTAYQDAVGIWTIGYGHTGKVHHGQTISEQQAEDLLRSDLKHAESSVERSITVDLTDNQFAALVAFTFNVGGGALASSTLAKKLNAGDYAAVPAQLERWSKVRDRAHGGYKVLAGLLKRRKAEGALWSSDGSFTDNNTVDQHEQQSTQTEAMVYEEYQYIRFEVTAPSGLRMRQQPDTSADIIQVLPYQTLLYIGQHTDIWVAVDLQGNGQVDGWVAEEYLSPVIR